MSWMDLSEYLLIERAVIDRLADLRDGWQGAPVEETAPAKARPTTSALGRSTNDDDGVRGRLGEAA